MKKVLVLIAMGLCICGQCGCDSSTTHQSNYIDLFVDYPSVSDSCCGINRGVYISGVSPVGGRYYYLALVQNGVLRLSGEPEWLPAGPYNSVALFVQISYLDRLEAGTYETVVYACESPNDVGKQDNRSMAAGVGVEEISDYSEGEGCDTCCSKDPGDASGRNSRRHCAAAKDLGNVIGVRSEIKTRHGYLCASGVSTSEAQYNAYVDLQNNEFSTEDPTAWVQAGYMRYRPEGHLDWADFVFFEYMHPSFQQRVFMPLVGASYPAPPQDGEDHRYEIVRRPNGLAWSFLYDDDTVLQTNDAGVWIDTLGRWATWQTEILKRETDMPGTDSDRCEFRNCEYLTTGNQYRTAVFGYPDVVRCSGIAGNPIEWDCTAYFDTLWTWDVNPLDQIP